MATLTDVRVRLPALARYEFQKPIGTGGMGTVYRAHDRRTGSPVAIKVLRTRCSQDPVLHQRVAREFRAASELVHPNIVRAVECETVEDVTYLVYELVEGGSLCDRMDHQPRFTEAEAVRIITQIGQALEYAHARGVVHRDVKPDNILLLPDGRAKLADFGLAKTVDSHDDGLTRPASGLGTPQFMAPEQFADAANVDARCDIYSLGATLYTMVTGRFPFSGKTALAIVTQKEFSKFPSARSVVPGLSERIDAVISAALKPNPAERPQSCLAFFRLLTGKKKKGKEPPTTGSHFVGTANRRTFVRYAVGLGVAGGVDPAVQSGSELENWPAVIKDLSAGGVGVLLARRFEPGTELLIELGDSPQPSEGRLAARVVRVQSERNGHWIHGCIFQNPLTQEQMAALIKRVMS